MRYLYWALIALAILVVIVLLVKLIFFCIKRRACKKVKAMTTPMKVTELENALNPFGFMYVPKGDVVGSTMHNWQREMGYCWWYDKGAPAMFMIIDCEPIYFNYNGKRWLLEFWKGQYGMTTGAEIGLYVNDTASEYEDPCKLFYRCANDDERVQMQYTLYKNGKPVLERSDLHWWLTGFLVGEYSKCTELTMDCVVCFPNMAMRRAVYKGLLRAGYQASDVAGNQCCIKIHFDRPRTKQPYRCGPCKLGIAYVKWRMHRNCKIYMRQTKCMQMTLDKIVFVGHCFPCLYRKLVRMGTKYNRRKCRKYGKRKYKP
ncbi:MAG: DUF4474 domain-containing protein [Lachnospiraceae bacterium]|jgi:hypothetical protein|nr:DUF4474 domain-containing protein [Lachnospiraceae bacterium]